MGGYTITKSKFHDPFYDSWYHYYTWDGYKWVYIEWEKTNESGMMVPFAHTVTEDTRTSLLEEDCKFILNHFGLTELDVPLRDVPTISPAQLKAMATAKEQGHTDNQSGGSA